MVGLRKAHGAHHGAHHAVHRDADVVRITTAPESPEREMAHRQKRYIISMSIRTVCFVAAIVADGGLRWVLVAAAFVLPYVAVVMANSATPRVEGTMPPGPPSGQPELGPGRDVGRGPHDG
jgi:hypothetical protein